MNAVHLAFPSIYVGGSSAPGGSFAALMDDEGQHALNSHLLAAVRLDRGLDALPTVLGSVEEGFQDAHSAGELLGAHLGDQLSQALAQPFRIRLELEEFIQFDLQPLGQPNQQVQRRVLPAALDAAQILGIDLHTLGKLLLRILPPLPQVSDPPS
jgi:hypothetical protein